MSITTEANPGGGVQLGEPEAKPKKQSHGAVEKGGSHGTRPGPDKKAEVRRW
jgi:hypothetical protein